MIIKCLIINILLLFSVNLFSQGLLDIGEKTSADSIVTLALRKNNAIKIGAGNMLMKGDFNTIKYERFLELQLTRFISPKIAFSGNLKKFNVENYDFENQGFLSGDLNLGWCILPEEKFSPFVFAGAGILTSNDFKDKNYKVQGGLSLEYLITKRIALVVSIEANYVYDEQKGSLLLQQVEGTYYNAKLGVQFYFGNKHNSKVKKKQVSTETPSVRDSNSIDQY
jgi:curli production assembly/transport component CsgG